MNKDPQLIPETNSGVEQTAENMNATGNENVVDSVITNTDESATDPQAENQQNENPIVTNETQETQETQKAEPSKKTRGRKSTKKTEQTSSKTKSEDIQEDDLMDKSDFSDDDNEQDDDADEEPQPDYSVLTKEELVEKLEELVKEDNVSRIKNRVAGIKVAYLNMSKAEKQAHLEKFLAEGGAKEDYIQPSDPLEERFKAAFEIYKEKKAKEDEQLEKQKRENLELKKQILEEIKQLINSEESLKKTYDEFKNLQEKWRQIGQVPRNEIESLWNNYHYLVEKFLEKVKISKELKDLDLKKNLEAKIRLCEKAEELLLEKSITRSFKLLQKYHDEWKEIGPVPQDKKDEIWERFKTVSDKINQQRREYYEKLHAEQEANLLAKTALCQKIEAIIANDIQTVAEWKAKTAEVIEMQELWESIGRTPAKYNEEIWERFRTAVNTFFNNKKEFFSELKEQQLTNYNQKLDLCVQAEALLNTTNWKQATAELLKLQQEWKKIGPVPKKHSEKIWKRFRSACDEFFKRKSEYFANIHTIEQENLAKKQELIANILNYELKEDKNENLNALKNFQRQWMEIGHVPIEAKEKLQNEYRNALNKLMEKMKISAVEIDTLEYKNRIESIQSSPDAGKILSKERFHLETKINALKNDIKLWENNIGFLANSKNANILKQEFENKILKAKQELALLEAKLNLLLKMKK